MKQKIIAVFFSLLRIVLITYLSLWVFLYFFQSHLIYHPSQGDFYDCKELENYNKITYNNTRFYKLSQWGKWVLIHYHGNAWRACDRAFKQWILELSGNDIIFVEYSWYGWDSLSPNKTRLEKNVRDIKRYITKSWYNTVIVYGESIGTWLASYHASLWKVEKLLLVSPFSSIWDLAQKHYSIYPISLLLRENYDNIWYLKNFSKDIIIIHGINDVVIPINLSKKLYDSLDNVEQKQYFLIPESGHNDIWNSEIFLNTFSNLLQ